MYPFNLNLQSTEKENTTIGKSITGAARTSSLRSGHAGAKDELVEEMVRGKVQEYIQEILEDEAEIFPISE